MRTINIIELGWSIYNQIEFYIFRIETDNFGGSLLGFNITTNYFILDIFYFQIVINIYKPF